MVIFDSLFIKYIDAPCGAGKTSFICEEVLSLLGIDQKVLICQPTKTLIDRTYDTLMEAGADANRVRKIHSDSKNSNLTVKSIIDAFKSADQAGFVILITHSAFDLVPYFHRARDFDLIFDECPPVWGGFELRVPKSHSMLTTLLHVDSAKPYARIEAKSPSGLAQILENGAVDDTYRQFFPMAKAIAAEGWDTYVETEKFEALVAGDARSDQLSVYAVRNTGILGQFRTCTVISARMKETFFFKIMSNRGVQFVPYDMGDKKLSYDFHENGSLLTIRYPEVERWSKRLVETNPKAIDELKAHLIASAKDKEFIFLANKNMLHHSLIAAKGIELSGSPHGLNQYNNIDIVGIIAAYNPKPHQAKFLKWLGLSTDEIDTAMHCQIVYQAIMRCSLREPKSTTPKVVVVPDIRTAIWLQGVFPGSTLDTITLPSIQPPKTGGRPRKHVDDAERQRAYRERIKKTKKVTTTNAPVDISELAVPIGHNVRYDCYIKDNDFVTTAATKQSLVWTMNLYRELKAVGAESMVPFRTISDIASYMRSEHQKSYACKNGAPLFNFTKYNGDPAISRKSEDAIGTTVLILDNDGNGISPDKFMEIFKYEKMIIVNSYSSQPDNKKWRVIIPLSRMVSVEEYGFLYDGVMAELTYRGYVIPKPQESRPYDKAHGFDQSKRNIVSIFYVPCQAKAEGGSFFEAVVGDDRELMDPDDWMMPDFSDISSPSIVPELPEDDDSEAKERDPMESLAFQRTLREYRTSGVLPGNGDAGLFKLGSSAAGAGFTEQEVEVLLKRESNSAHSPEDRLSQIPRILDWLRDRRAFKRH